MNSELRHYRRIQRDWEQHARIWNTHEGLYHDPDIRQFAIEQIRGALVPFQRRLAPDQRMLDLSSGANPYDYFFSRINKDRVVALDLSRSALELNESGGRTVADTRMRLPFAPESFALVTMIFGWRYLEEEIHSDVLREIRRVLTPGGSFVLVDLPSNEVEHAVCDFDPVLLLGRAHRAGFALLEADTILEFADLHADRFGEIGQHILIERVSGVKPEYPRPAARY